MKNFTLYREADASGVSGTGRILDGVVWHTGQVTVCWRTDVTGSKHGYSSLGVYPSWEAFHHIHIASHPTNQSRVEWLDEELLGPQSGGSKILDAGGSVRPAFPVGVAGVVVRGRHALFARSPPDHPVYGGCWALPGGGVEDWDANLAAALSRELEEETGLLVASQDWKLLHADFAYAEGVRCIMVYFWVCVADDTPEPVNREPEKHLDWAWLPVPALSVYDVRDRERFLARWSYQRSLAHKPSPMASTERVVGPASDD